MSERKLKILLPIVILALGLIITVAMVKSRSPVAIQPPQDYTPLVRVMNVSPSTFQLVVKAHGTVHPRTETALVSEVAGRVLEVSRSFAAGGFFSRGDVLVRIDPRDYELAVVTARSQVAKARVLLGTEEAQAEVARKEWEVLGEGDPSPLATRELQLQEARATLASAEATLERAKRDLERTRITAPFDGRVRSKLVDIGQYVAPGTPIGHVFAVDYAEVSLPIPDSDLAFLDIPINFDGGNEGEAGPRVLLSADFAGERRQWWGRVVRVEGEIDPVSRTVTVVAQVDDPYGLKNGPNPDPLAVGLFVDAEIYGREVADAIVLPRSALRGADEVLVLDEESRLRFRKVAVLRKDRSEVIITGGVEPNEEVCVSLLEAVTDGMKVRASSVNQVDKEIVPPAGVDSTSSAPDSSVTGEAAAGPRAGSTPGPETGVATGEASGSPEHSPSDREES